MMDSHLLGVFKPDLMAVFELLQLSTSYLNRVELDDPSGGDIS